MTDSRRAPRTGLVFVIRLPAAIARTAAGRMALRGLRAAARLKSTLAKKLKGGKPLTRRQCVPCRGLTRRFTPRETAKFMRMVRGWRVVRNHHLVKTYKFRDFAQGLALVDRIGAIAEHQFHHPDLFLAWGRVDVKIWTHAVDGLSQNDFILAARCDAARALLKA